MNKILNKCAKCKTYTLKDTCKCGGKVTSAHPPKFSLYKEEKYGKYRRQAKA